MRESGNWSNDSQEFSKMCILESQIESKQKDYEILKLENEHLKGEVRRLEELVKTLTKTNINTDILDRFK